MTQTAETVKSTPSQFNLLLVPHRATAAELVKHYGLNDVRYLDEMEEKLHLGRYDGKERGDVFNRALAENGTTTVVVLQDEAWIKALLEKSEKMAPMVWRSIEAKLMGHRTNGLRNLMLVATSAVDNLGVRICEENGKLLKLTHGNALPTAWLAPKAEKPVKEKQSVIGEYVEKRLKPRVDAAKKGDIKEAVRLKSLANPGSPAKPAPKGDRRPQHKGNANVLFDDLYLLCKGHYGAFNLDAVRTKVAHLIRHHGGLPAHAPVSDEQIIVQLFDALTRSSSRGYWGGYTLLKDTVHAGAHSPDRLLSVLVGQIGAIPAVDTEGKPLRQPQANKQLVKVLEKYDLSEVEGA